MNERVRPQADGRPLVAHVVYRFDVGGLENGVVNLINRLPADRYDHAVIALTEVTDFRKRVTRDRVSFHAMQKSPGHGVAIYRDLYRLFRQLRPAIVHTRNIAASEAQLPAALAGVPVRIHGEHGWEVRDVAGGRWTHHLQRRLLRPFIHRHVALSNEIRAYLEQRVGVPAAVVTQICNGVDVDRFTALRASRDARSGPIGERFPESNLFVIGTVGRLSPVKNQRLLIDGFARTCKMLDALAPDRSKQIRLVVVGDGADRAALEARVVGSGYADRIWMAGARDDVAALMADFDLFVLPSLAEGISNTILEAMACGLPVVATRVGGNAELVDDGRTGSLIPSDDVVAMATTLRTYAQNAPRVEAEGRAARVRATSRFSIDAMVSRYSDLYDTQLDLRRPSRHASLAGPTSVVAATESSREALGSGQR